MEAFHRQVGPIVRDFLAKLIMIIHQDVAASCIFLATKTEECGRKLRDVAKICNAKITGMDPNTIPNDSKVWRGISVIKMQPMRCRR